MTDREVAELAQEEAEAVAIWAFTERQKTPGWRLFRRRWLLRVFKEKGAAAERMEAALDDADRRAKGLPPRPKDPGKPTRWGPGA